MHYLLMYVAEEKPFDASRVKEALVGMSGMSNVRDEGTVACAVEGAFREGADSILVRLSEDHLSMIAQDAGRTAALFVVEFTRAYGEPLHLINDTYDFDLVLDGTEPPSRVLQSMTAATADADGG